MASLLDVIVARRNPQLAGLLGVPAEQPASAGLLGGGGEQPPAAGGGGVGGALSQVFTGPDDPGLPEEANAQARQQALLQAGLATLAGGGGDARGIQRLAQGALLGQQIGQETRSRIREDFDRRQRLAQISAQFESGMDRNSVSQALRVSISQGDSEMSKVLTSVLKEFPEPDPEDAGLKVVNLDTFGSFLMDEDGNFFDPFTKERVTETPELPEEIEDPLEGAFTDTILDPESGNMVRVRFDKAGNPIRVMGIAKAPEPVEQGDLAGMSRQLDQNLTSLQRLVEEHGPPNELHERLPNRVKPEWVQQYEAAAGNINILASRLMFSARVSDSEREALSAVLTPRAGDHAGVIRQKMENLRRLVSDFKAQQNLFDPDREEGSGGLSRYGVTTTGSRLRGALGGN